jgi:hypothetical protein
MNGDGSGSMTLLLLLLLLPYAHLLSLHQKRRKRKIGKEEEKETEEENFLGEGHMKMERGVPRPMSSSNFSRKRIGCKSNCNSSKRIVVNLVFRFWGHVGVFESKHFLE